MQNIRGYAKISENLFASVDNFEYLANFIIYQLKCNVFGIIIKENCQPYIFNQFIPV